MLEFEIYELLQKYGIQTPKYHVFSIDEPLDFNIFPAVLKIASQKVVHKSDVGGVIADIPSKEKLQEAKEKLLKNLESHHIVLDKNDFLLVEEQIKGDEFYIGGIFDPIFEEVLLFGKGGIFIEIEKDICYIDTKASEEEIVKSFKTTKISKIFPSFRGKEYKMEFVIDTIKKFQEFFEKEDITEFDVNPLLYTPDGFVAVDARVKKKEKKKKDFHPKKGIFENEHIAIFGASDKPQKVGYALAKNALSSKAHIYFVNPHLDTLFGQKVYKSEDELPPIDTAVIAIPSKYVVSLVEKLAQRGVKNVIVISAGFKEIGNIEAEERLKKIAQKYNINLIGPNCLGIYNGKKELNLTFATSFVKPGDLGIISQSGAVLAALMDRAALYGIGFSHILSLGNMADFNFAHAIEALSEKEDCKTIAVYAEGLQNGKAYLQAIRKAQKDVMVYKAGKTQEAKKAAFSHTGNLSGDYAMFVGLSQAAGAILKNDIDELIFASRYKAFEEVVIVTNAGGPGTILTDIVVSHGKKIHRLSKEEMEALNKVLPPTWSHNNPIDIIGDATSKRYKAALDVVSQIEALKLVIVTPQFMTDGLEIAKVVMQYNNTIPIFFGGKNFEDVFQYFQEHNFLYFNDLENIANIL